QVRANSSPSALAGTQDGQPTVQGELFPFGANVNGEGEAPAKTGEGEAPAEPGATGSAGASPSQTAQWKATYHLIDTENKFADFLKQIKKQKRFAVDLETTGLDPLRSDIVGFAFSWQEGEGWYVAVRGPAGEPTLDPEKTLAQLRPILENARVAKVNQNIKYDLL